MFKRVITLAAFLIAAAVRAQSPSEAATNISGSGNAGPKSGLKSFAEFPVLYTDAARHFTLRLPGGLERDPNPGNYGYPAGSVMFRGFAIPARTTLEKKSLIIVPGDDPEMQDSKALGHFTAGNVNFVRWEGFDGSAGHFGRIIIYRWTRGDDTLDFDFYLFSVDPGMYDPSERPPEYNMDDQIKYSERLMGTFRLAPGGH